MAKESRIARAADQAAAMTIRVLIGVLGLGVILGGGVSVLHYGFKFSWENAFKLTGTLGFFALSSNFERD